MASARDGAIPGRASRARVYGRRYDLRFALVTASLICLRTASPSSRPTHSWKSRLLATLGDQPFVRLKSICISCVIAALFMTILNTRLSGPLVEVCSIVIGWPSMPTHFPAIVNCFFAAS